MEKAIELLEEDYNSFYDYIANEGYKLSKDELQVIIKELIWALYKNVDKSEQQEIFSEIAANLKEANE